MSPIQTVVDKYEISSVDLTILFSLLRSPNEISLTQMALLSGQEVQHIRVNHTNRSDAHRYGDLDGTVGVREPIGLHRQFDQVPQLQSLVKVANS